MISSGEGRDPGGEPGGASAAADEEREHAADRGGERSEATFPIVWSRRIGRSGRTPVFDSSGIGQHARRERADCDEADLAEREHTRGADEDVDRDHDRDRDERVQEVDLVRARDESSRSRCDDEQPGPSSVSSAVSYAVDHRRASAGEEPAGRRSRTRITSAKTAEGRKTVLSSAARR